MWWIVFPILAVAVFLVLALTLYFSAPSRRDFDLDRRHALITGGSKGIGKQLAVSLIARGASVSIIARNEKDLKAAAEELQTLCDQRGRSQQARWYSCDLTKSYEEVERAIRLAEAELGPVDCLINNAGHSVQDAFDALPIGDFEKQMKVNYLSAVYASRAVVGGMKQRRFGHISFVSSAAGQCAIWGYTAYSATKFALRGFADALHMELLPHRVSVALLYPPNTDTEGFAEELRTMPEEVRLISETAGLFEPGKVAEAHVSDIACGEYCTTMGVDGWMLGVLTAGAAPEKNMAKALTQLFLGGILRAVMLIYIGYFNNIVKRCHRARIGKTTKTSKAQ